jgi:hypothetical protein
MIVSATILLGIVLISYRISKLISPQLEETPFIVAIITAFYYPLVYWSLRGMEVGIAILLVYLSVLIAIFPSPRSIDFKRALILGLVMLFAIVVRFDVILQISIILVFVIYENIKSKTRFISISPVLFLYLIGIVIVLLFQYIYFGSVYPNTYYLKIVGVSLFQRLTVGIQVFVEYATRDFLWPLLIIISGIIYFRELRENRVYLLLSLFIVQCIYSIYVGGDYAEPLNSPQVDAANRFIAQGMPSVIILFGVTIIKFLNILLKSKNTKSSRVHRRSSILILALSLSTIVIISGEPWFKWTIHNAPLLDSDIWRTKLGLQIRKYTDDNATIAAHAVGQISYYSDRRIIDLLGKSDPIVAMSPPTTSFRPGHNKWNYEYSIMTLKPDLIADEWGQVANFLKSKYEYYRLPNGIYIRQDSNLLNITGLSQDYK